MRHRISVLTGLGLALAAAPAWAHPGHAATFTSGVLHPFSGLDHLLAMVSVGLWAALRGGKAVWAWPAAFISAMLIGFGLGGSGLGLPLVEPMILASVTLLGVLIAADARAPLAAGAALIGLFGLAHGYAHGVNAQASGPSFALGLTISTFSLHLLGLGVGRLQRPVALRLLGAGAALGGLILAVAG